LLADAKQIVSYEVDGKSYGYIPTFLEHQRITGTEAKSEGQYPEPPSNPSGNNLATPKKPQIPQVVDSSSGNDLETTGKQQGRLERERIIGKGLLDEETPTTANGSESERNGKPTLQQPTLQLSRDDLMQAVTTELRITEQWTKVSISEQIRLALEA